MKNILWFVLLPVSAFISYWAAEKLFKSETIAVILVASIFLHEVGHWATLRRYGYKARMVFIPLLGAFVKPEDDNAFDKIHRRQMAIVTLAGPAVNVSLVFLGLMIAVVPEWYKVGMTLASLNAGLTAFNLLPLAFLDGGHYTRCLFESTNEKTDRIMMVLVSGIALAFGLGLALSTGHVTYYVAAIVFGFHRASGKDKPNAWREKRSMKLDDAWTTLVVYLAMLLGSILLYIQLPMWSQIYK